MTIEQDNPVPDVEPGKYISEVHAGEGQSAISVSLWLNTVSRTRTSSSRSCWTRGYCCYCGATIAVAVPDPRSDPPEHVTAVLLGIGIYAIFAYTGDELDGYQISRYLFLAGRIVISFLAVGFVIGWDEWYLGFAVVGISRIASRLDTYVTIVSTSILQQRRR